MNATIRPAEPLSAYTCLESVAPDDVHDQATALMNRHRMRLGTDAARFSATLRAAEAGGLGLLYFRYGATAEIASAPLDDFAAVHLPLRGGLQVLADGTPQTVGPGGGVVFSEQDEVRMRWSADLELLVLRVHRSALARKIRALTGHKVERRVVFAPIVGGRGRSAGLARLVRTFQECVDEYGPGRMPAVMISEFEDLLLSALVLGHQHNYSDVLQARRPGTPSRSVSLAIDFIRAHEGEAMTVDDIARASHVSERSLYDLFHREFGQTPMGFVRRTRLESAREILLAAEPGDGTTVATVARALALGHVGRFATDYRRRYGETPSDTLRR